MFIYLLIHELPFDFIGRVDDLPPEQLVEVVRDGLEQSFGDVDMASPVDNLFIDELGDFGHGIVRWPIDLESLTGSSIIECYLLKSCTDVDGLR